MEEKLDIFDCDYNYLGEATKKLAHKLGLWHQVFHCWIFNPETNKLLLQLRSKNKPTDWDLLDISAAGHISAGESVADGVRELEEELGLKVDVKNLIYAGYWKLVTDKMKSTDPNYKNREFCHTYFLKESRPITDYKIQEEELDGLFEIDIYLLRKLFLKEVESITVSGWSKQNKNDVREVTVESFTKREGVWLKVINIIEDIQNGRNRVYI